MKATEAQFLKFLQRTSQFIIPIYQRTYSWTTAQCGQLWDDIIRAATDDSISAHFVGSVVYIERGIYQNSAVPELLVIDGQQRLTTVSLILAALARAMESSPEIGEMTPLKLTNYYLLNSNEEGPARQKLVLTQNDQGTLFAIVNKKPEPAQPSQRIMENFRFFTDKIARSSLAPSVIYRGVAKLIIVDIALNRDHDNPQLIFESLNSTGLALSQADLIRNYVLMGLEPDHQKSLYEDHWRPMEVAFGQADYTAHFDDFMRDYLTVRTGQIPNISLVYQHFKAHAQGAHTGSIDEIVADVHRFAGYYVNIALGKEPRPDFRAAFAEIIGLKVAVTYPFFLEVYHDYSRGIITAAELIAIIRLIESYVVRRAICGIPTNSLNRTFQTLIREIRQDRYLESLQAALLLMPSYRRFPHDEEFTEAFIVRDIYNLAPRRNYILRKLENHQRKEVVNIEALTIEHIMPQNPNLSPAWQAELGSDWRTIQERYLHTIGNLTLTGYNPELSDRPFREKRDLPGGFRQSPLRLNQSLALLEHWNETEIRRRAAALAELATEVWPAPKLFAEILARYAKIQPVPAQTYTFTDHPFLTGPMMDLFQQFRRRVLNLDSSVTEEILKLYIAYKTDTNFVDVVPRKSRLRLSLNLAFPEIEDPRGWCKDVTNIGRWGNGDVEVHLEFPDQLDYVMFLV